MKTAKVRKAKRSYPNLLDAWSALAGISFFLLGGADIFYMFSRYGVAAHKATALDVVMFIYLGISIILLNVTITRYLKFAYGMSAWEQAITARSINLRLGMHAFSSDNLKAYAQLIGLPWSSAVKAFYSYLAIDGLAVVLGVLTR